MALVERRQADRQDRKLPRARLQYGVSGRVRHSDGRRHGVSSPAPATSPRCRAGTTPGWSVMSLPSSSTGSAQAATPSAGRRRPPRALASPPRAVVAATLYAGWPVAFAEAGRRLGAASSGSRRRTSRRVGVGEDVMRIDRPALAASLVAGLCLFGRQVPPAEQPMFGPELQASTIHGPPTTSPSSRRASRS